MREIILNGHVKIKPLEYDGFVSQKDKKYEKVGVVVAKDEKLDIPIGSKCFFDSWMAKKYPVPGKENEYEWFVPYSEIVKYEITD
jgi:hypothetical protein